MCERERGVGKSGEGERERVRFETEWDERVNGSKKKGQERKE